MSLIKKLAGETAIYGISSIVGRLINYLLVPYLTRILPTEQYGIISEFYAYVGFLIVIFTYRMETTFFRFGDKPENRDNAFSTASISIVASTLILCLSIILLSQPIANWLDYPDQAAFVIWFALILSFDALVAVPFARLRLERKALKFVSIKMLNIGLNVGFTLYFFGLCPYLVKQGYSPLFYKENIGYAYVFIANLIASAATLLFLLPAYLKINLNFDKALWKKMMRYATPLILVGFAGVVNEMLDRTLLKELLPYDKDTNLSHLGIYSANYKLAMLMTMFIQAFNYAAEPFFFRNADRADAKPIYAKVAQLFTLVGTLGFLGILLYIDIFKHFLDDEYWVGLTVVPILLMANLFLGLYYNFAIWYKLTDKTLFGAYIAIAGASITVLLNVLWIPTLGYVGSAWATLICYIFMSMACYVFGRKHFPVPYKIFRIITYVLLAAGVYFLSTYLKPFCAQQIQVYLLSTGLLLGYMAIIYLMERNTGLFKL